MKLSTEMQKYIEHRGPVHQQGAKSGVLRMFLGDLGIVRCHTAGDWVETRSFVKNRHVDSVAQPGLSDSTNHEYVHNYAPRYDL